jgi:hypothetical protein
MATKTPPFRLIKFTHGRGRRPDLGRVISSMLHGIRQAGYSADADKIERALARLIGSAIRRWRREELDEPGRAR